MIKRTSVDWDHVAKTLHEWSNISGLFLSGQVHSLKWMAEQLPKNGIIIADEVGLGKTRLALLAMYATMLEGGRVAVVVPPGLLDQWSKEAKDTEISLRNHGVNLSGKNFQPFPVRSYSDLFYGSKSQPKLTFPLCDGDQWILMSQTFDLYLFRKNTPTWRLELPALVNARYQEQEGERKNTRWIQYLRKRGYEGLAEEKEWLVNHLNAANYLAKHFKKTDFQAHLLFEEDALRPSLDGSDIARLECVRLFQKDGDGRKLLMDMVGKLIGPIDLLIMDEAHKSRESGEKVETRFGRIVEEIIDKSSKARRIAMTATPVELSPDQWGSLLRRIDVPKAQRDSIEKVILEFASALAGASGQPDVGDKIDKLCSASTKFCVSLAPFVTRRRKWKQGDWINLIPEEMIKKTHPHRRESDEGHIGFEELSSLEEPQKPGIWKRLVLVLEGHGMAAKGSDNLGMKERQTDIRYSQGLEIDFEEDDTPSTSDVEPMRKEQRVDYWKRLRRAIHMEAGWEKDNWLWNHPRILKAGDRIEALCDFGEGTVPREKVLVFGRFNNPMQVLRNVINARQLLRIIDREGIAPLLDDNRLTPAFLHSVWKDRMTRSPGIFNGHLADPCMTPDRIVKLAENAKKKYADERDRLAKRINADNLAIWTKGHGNDETFFPGDGAIEKLREMRGKKMIDSLFAKLRSDVFDRLLYKPEGRSVEPDEQELKRLLLEIWEEHLDSLLNAHQDETSDSDGDGEGSALDKLDNRADSLSPEDLIEAFGLDQEDGVESPMRSSFCRTLDGSVAQTTRRAIKAGFNSKERGPFVLIAQSVVGREGLNLHLACRHVILFHPEWNPAVLEQQIGRVDRIESLWCRMAKEAKKNGCSEKDFPRIEIEPIIFDGTYDAYQFNILTDRRRNLNAQLFGELLDEEAMRKLSPDDQKKLAQAAPDWSPQMSNDKKE